MVLEFVKPVGPNDHYSEICNVMGNCALYTCGGMCLSVINYVALQILGFGKVVAAVAAVVPLCFASVCGFLGTCLATHIYLQVSKFD